MTFQEKLDARIDVTHSFLCIGLDPVFLQMPKRFINTKDPFFYFNKYIIDTTYQYATAYKPNSAFYEAHGEAGIRSLKLTCDYIQHTHKSIPLILDAKRGDIGSTNEGYIQYAFDYLSADALTLHPYLGSESLEPFFKKKDKGYFIMCKNSNPGAGELQNLKVGDKMLFEVIAERVSKEWNKNNNCMLVVGATYPEELKRVRKIVDDMTLLVPGVGAQGGLVSEVMSAARNQKGRGLIVSVTRDIIYSEKPGEKARSLAAEMSS